VRATDLIIHLQMRNLVAAQQMTDVYCHVVLRAVDLRLRLLVPHIQRSWRPLKPSLDKSSQNHAVTTQCRRYGVQQMSVAELRGVLDDEDLRDTVQLLDVREPWEAEESSLPHFTLLPLSRWGHHAWQQAGVV
jgi:hypothetical protein